MILHSKPEPRWSIRQSPRCWAALAAAWGFAEGFFFFIIPDILISLGAALHPKQAMRLVLCSILGAMMAGISLFCWSSQYPEASLSFVSRVPFVKTWMIDQTKDNWSQHNYRALYIAPTQGIPYKLNAVIAPQHTDLTHLLIHTIPSRGLRFVLAWGIAAGIGIIVRKRFKKANHFNSLTIIVITFWIINYALYWSSI